MKHTEIQFFNDIFKEHYQPFIHFASGYVNDKEVAKDIVSEAFTTFWEKRTQFSEEDNHLAYILTIVKNKCLNHLQHNKTKIRIQKEIDDHEAWLLNLKINTLEACDPEFLFSNEIQQIIDETLLKLSPKTRKIFMSNRYDQLSYKQIAEELELSTKSVEFHMSKSLYQLRLALKDFIVFISMVIISLNFLISI